MVKATSGVVAAPWEVVERAWGRGWARRVRLVALWRVGRRLGDERLFAVSQPVGDGGPVVVVQGLVEQVDAHAGVSDGGGAPVGDEVSFAGGDCPRTSRPG